MPGLIPQAELHWQALAKLAKKTKALTSIMTLSDLATRELTPKDAKKQVSARQLPPVTYYCDTARSAMMQTDWHKRSGRMAIDFSRLAAHLEIIGPKGLTLLCRPLAIAGGVRWPVPKCNWMIGTKSAGTAITKSITWIVEAKFGRRMYRATPNDPVPR